MLVAVADELEVAELVAVADELEVAEEVGVEEADGAGAVMPAASASVRKCVWPFC